MRSETDAYYIVRTAWLYGEHGKCFPKTMAKLSDSHPQLSVVTDEVGQPTWTRDLADLIIRLVEAGAPSGIYHGTASGQTNWHGFTKEIIAAYGKDPAIVGRPRPLPLSARRRGRRTLSSPMTPSTQSASRRLVTGKSAGRGGAAGAGQPGDTQSPARQCWSRRNR